MQLIVEIECILWFEKGLCELKHAVDRVLVSVLYTKSIKLCCVEIKLLVWWLCSTLTWIPVKDKLCYSHQHVQLNRLFHLLCTNLSTMNHKLKNLWQYAGDEKRVKKLFQCNCTFPDDGPVRAKTCRIWHVMTLLWFWWTVCILDLHCSPVHSYFTAVFSI